MISPDRPTGARRLLRRYGPFVAIGLSVALVIAIAPTTSSSSTNAFAGYQGGRQTNGPPTTVNPSRIAALKKTGNCARQAFFPGATCVQPWHANNGGATYQGVSGKQINIIYYLPSLGSQITSIGQLAGLQPLSVEQHEVAVFSEFFNRNFQTYGRHVNFVVFQSQQQIGNTAGARSDAVAIDQQYHPFLEINGQDQNFLDEASQRGMESITTTQLPQSIYASHSPFVWGLLPSTNTTDSHLGEYITKKLGKGSKASFGGTNSNPPVNGQPRRYGIIYPTTAADGSPSVFSSVANDLQSRLARGGIQVTAKVGYSQDITSAQTQATNEVSQLQAAHVTSVICLCDPLAPIYLTKAAANQGYYPEWIESGYLIQDVDQLGRLYDQSEWQHALGISSLPPPVAPQDSPATKAFKSIDPAGGNPPIDSFAVFSSMLVLFTSLEIAGPNLNPRTFANAMFRLYLPSPSFYYTRHDYGGLKDAMEVWWDPNAKGPDGIKGHYQDVDGAHRFLLTQWPNSPTKAFQPLCLAKGSCGGPR